MICALEIIHTALQISDECHHCRNRKYELGHLRWVLQMRSTDLASVFFSIFRVIFQGRTETRLLL